MAEVAITGAAGFIGSNLAHRVAADGHRLLLVDHPLPGVKPSNWAGLDAFGFLTHERFLEELAAGRVHPDVIFHLGACSSTTETDWAYLDRNNIGYTRRLWDWCTPRGIPFLYASSAATYGDGSSGFDDRTHPADLKPLNLYGRSKNDFDLFAVREAEAGRPCPPRWAGLKFFNVYGPRERHKGRMASVVFQAWRQIHATGSMKLFKSTDRAWPDGGQTRDFVFVEDNVDHLLWLWKNPAPNGLYNSGTGEPRTFLDLTRAVFAALGREADIRFIEMPADLAGKYQNFTKAEMTKLRSAGYERRPTTLEQGVARTVAWLEADRAA
jgi:ADP-L-glycero-D-manno-heptose 6-epimerase